MSGLYTAIFINFLTTLLAQAVAMSFPSVSDIVYMVHCVSCAATVGIVVAFNDAATSFIRWRTAVIMAILFLLINIASSNPLLALQTLGGTIEFLGVTIPVWPIASYVILWAYIMLSHSKFKDGDYVTFDHNGVTHSGKIHAKGLLYFTLTYDGEDHLYSADKLRFVKRYVA